MVTRVTSLSTPPPARVKPTHTDARTQTTSGAHQLTLCCHCAVTNAAHISKLSHHGAPVLSCTAADTVQASSPSKTEVRKQERRWSKHI